MDAVSVLVTVPPASSDTTTTIQESTNSFNVNQSNNNNTHTHANAHISSNSLTNKTTSNVIGSSCSNSNLNIGSCSHSINSNSSCSSSSTSSNSSGYGSCTTTPTNNYDLQQTTPTTTPIPTTPAPITEHIIPVATVAAVTPFYNESITTQNSEGYYVQHHHHHTQQQTQQSQQHHLLQNSHHQYSQNLLQSNLQQQHHQYLPRQQYYSPYEYQQTLPSHNLSGSSATPAVAPYNMIFPGPYEKSTSATTNYERSSIIKTNAAAQPPYNNQQQQQQQQQHQQSEQQRSKTINQETQHLTSLLGSSKQRSSSLISSSTNANTSKPQAAATPFYANPTPFYDNFKHKIPLEYHDSYSSTPSPTTAVSYHQQQKFYAAAKSQLKEASYGSPPTGLSSKSLYGNNGNFFPGPTAGLNLSSASYEKYMYPHNPATGYSNTGHLGNETPPEMNNYRKPLVGNTVNSPSWPWGIEYASGNSRSIPPPASHIPTATVAPTHATPLTQSPSVLARETYYMGHDKYAVKYDKYTTPTYQQPYVGSPANRHMWPNTAHASNLTSLNDRHLLASGPPAVPSHGLHTSSYFPSSSASNLNSRQSCCSQLPYQSQNCYYPASHAVPTRMPHTQNPTVPAPSGNYLTPQPTLGQSPHLNALNANCKYGGALADYGNGNKMKNSNDLYLNTHHYDNNTASHNFGYGSAHNSQPLYNTNAHQSMNHGLPTPASLLTNDSLGGGANSTSYTNDLSLTTSNYDNYHSHLDTHPSQQTLTGIHNPQPPPAYGVTVAKRALLDYRKPIQPQPPPTIAEECYTTLTSRDHYNQQDLLNTPETTTAFGEFEVHQTNVNQLTTVVLSDTDRDRQEENNKNLSLRDFIANWNDDEDEYQNNEEISFDQDTVIDEVLQTAPVEQKAEDAVAAAIVAIEEVKAIEPALDDAKSTETLEQSVKMVEDLSATTLSETETNQYVNLPDIVIDIEKSSTVNNSITTPATSPISTPLNEVNNTCLNLSNFDVEKELDELNLKKPTHQELTKLSNDANDAKNVTTPQLSPCKNLSFENINLEPSNNKTVLNAIASRLTTNNDLSEQYFKDIEGYESSSSRHSNESAFEKEYETFINKITSESCTSKSNKETNATTRPAEIEIDFEKNFQNFSKFYKRKRKLTEDEVKASVPAIQSKKKLKTSEEIKVNNSNFPQAYTKKSRNKLNKARLHSPHKRKPRSAYYKIIHSIRGLGLYRKKRVREFMTELKEKHLPLIKRQSIKNYTHDMSESLFNVNTLKALCIMAVNTEEFRQTLTLTMPLAENISPGSEEKHICTDPSCETCEVIKSLMEAESFERTLMQQSSDHNFDETATFASAIFCAEADNNGTITILEPTPPNTDDLSFRSEEHIVISNELANVQYSKENFPQAFETKDLEQQFFNAADVMKIVAHENVDLENYCEVPDTSILDLPNKHHSDIYFRTTSETEININSETYFPETDAFKSKLMEIDLQTEHQTEETSNTLTDNITPEVDPHKYKDSAAKFNPLNVTNISCTEKSLNVSCDTKIENLNNFICEGPELNRSLNESSTTEVRRNERSSVTNQDEESESEDSDSSESDTDSSSSSDTEDKSTSKKSSSNNESSDTNSATDSDREDEESSSGSDHSQHFNDNTPNKNFAGQERKKTLKRTLSCKYDDKKSKPSPTAGSKEKQQESLKQTNAQSSESEGSASEDENLHSSTQRIVIRIRKSSSLNDQSLRVENVFGKSTIAPLEANNKVESEQVSGTPKVSRNQVGCVPEKSLDSQTRIHLEDNANLKHAPVIIAPPLKLVLRRQDFSRGKNTERSEVSESESEIISPKKSEVNDSSPKQDGLMQEQRNFEDGKISETVSISERLSSRPETEDCNKCEPEMISINFTTKSKEEHCELNKAEHFSEQKCEMFSMSSPKQTISEEVEAIEKFTESREATENELSENEDKVLTPLEFKLKQKHFKLNDEFKQIPTSATECENIAKSDIENNFLLKSNEIPKIVSTDEHSCENSQVAIKVGQTSKLSPKDDHQMHSDSEDDHHTESESDDNLPDVFEKKKTDHGHSEIESIDDGPEKFEKMNSSDPEDDQYTETESEYEGPEEIKNKTNDNPKTKDDAHSESESDGDFSELFGKNNIDYHDAENESENDGLKKNHFSEPKDDHYTEGEFKYEDPKVIKNSKPDYLKDDNLFGNDAEDDAAEEFENNDCKDDHQTKKESTDDLLEEIKNKTADNSQDDYRSESESEDDATEKITKNKTGDSEDYQNDHNTGSESECENDSNDDYQTESESEDNIGMKISIDPKNDHYTESKSEDDIPEQFQKSENNDPENNHHAESESQCAVQEEVTNKNRDDPKDDRYTESEPDYDTVMKETNDRKDHHLTKCKSEYVEPENIEKKDASTSATLQQKLEKHEKETIPKKPALTNIEIYDLTSSESGEGECEDESDIEISSRSDYQESIPSISESGDDSEYESDEILEQINNLNNSNTIIISDDESMDSCNSKQQLQTKLKTHRRTVVDDFKTIGNPSQLMISKGAQKSLTDDEKCAVSRKQQELSLSNMDHENSPKVVQKKEDKIESVAVNHDKEARYPKIFHGKTEQQSIESEEKQLSEHTNSEKDFHDVTDAAMNDHQIIQKSGKEPLNESDSEVSESLSLECSKIPNSNDDIIETELPIEKESFRELLDCATENHVSNKSPNTIIESLSTLEENRESLQSLSFNVNQLKTETTESQETFQTLNLEVEETNNASLLQIKYSKECDDLQQTEMAVTEDVNMTDEKLETFPMLSENVNQMKPDSTEIISEDKNENSKPVLQIEKLTAHPHTVDVTDLELRSSNGIVKILEENESSEANCIQNIREEVTKGSRLEISTPMSEPKVNISQDIIEESIMEEPVKVEDEDLIEPEKFVKTNESPIVLEQQAHIHAINVDQILMENKTTVEPDENIILEDPKTPLTAALCTQSFSDHNLKDSAKIIQTVELLTLTSKYHSTRTEIISDAVIKETTISNDARDPEKPMVESIAGNMKILSEKPCESSEKSQIIKDGFLEASIENNTIIDQIASETHVKSLDCTDRDHKKELVDEKSNKSVDTVEAISQGLESALEAVKKNSSDILPTDGAKKILKKVPETCGQLIPKKTREILKDEEEQHLESISDHENILDEQTFEQTLLRTMLADKSSSSAASKNMEILAKTVKAEKPFTAENLEQQHSESISDESKFNKVLQTEDKSLEEICFVSETKKTAPTTEQFEADKQTFEEEKESELEISNIIDEPNKEKEEIIAKEKFVSDNILNTHLANVMDKEEIMTHSSNDVPSDSPAMTSCSLSPQTSKQSNEEKFENELGIKNPTNMKEVKTSEEELVVGRENSTQAEEEATLNNVEILESTEDKVLNKNETTTKSNRVDKNSEIADQTEHFNNSCKKTSSQRVPTKDCSTSDDMSRDFFGFKNQCSFEDESEDFHGFEDLEEVTRIRLEIENLNDDSTAANDGFLNNQILSGQICKATIASLAGSMSSELNELEALEKELSQHQPITQLDDEDQETDNILPIKPNEIASTNDIEHIKQMLESDEEQQSDAEDKIENLAHICKKKSIENNNNNNKNRISKDILSSVISVIPKLSDLCRAALNSSLNSISNLVQQHSETSTILVERELSVEEALAEMYRQAGVLLSDPEDGDNDVPASPQHNEAHDVLLINLQEILNSDNNDVYVLQCHMNENLLDVVQSAENRESEEEEHQDNNGTCIKTERVNTVQIILDTQNPEPQIHIISSDSESEVIILSDDDSEFNYRSHAAVHDRVTIPFINNDGINDSDNLFDISTIHHEEIVPDNLNKFLQEEFYKYLHEKYVQRNISKYYHANRILKKYKRRFIRTTRQLE